MRKRRYVEIACIACGKPRPVRADSAKVVRRCVKCAPAFIAKTRRPRAKAAYTCPCGTTFHPGNLGRKYCSRSCAMKHKPPPKQGKKYPHLQRAPVLTCPTCGESFRAVKTTKAKPTKYCSHRCYMLSSEETSLEAEVRQALRLSGIEHIAQHPLGPWTVDFYIPAWGLVIEADGDYWHSKPEVAAKDRRKDAWMADHGHPILHIAERDVAAGGRDVIRRRWTAWAQAHGTDPGPGALPPQPP